jgi:peptide/nickel transport system ATP-binding protein
MSDSTAPPPGDAPFVWSESGARPGQVSDGSLGGSAAAEVAGLRVRVVDGPDVVRDVTLRVEHRQILGLAGESGAGKTTTALAMLGYAQPGMLIASGTVRIGGQTLDVGNEAACRALRGHLVSYVPQDPGTALNPSVRVGDAVVEMMRQHPDHSDGDLASSLERVQLPADRTFLRRYPHELSGGQQQRLCIAIALACNPSVVVLDEPTTGLDVITQSVIVEQLRQLKERQGLSMVYVSHNLAVISQLADSLAVMYAGRVVEVGHTRRLVNQPLHPYTRGLVASIPDHRVPRAVHGIPGHALGVGTDTPGCAFAPRCELRTNECEEGVPPLAEVKEGGHARCIHIERVRVQPTHAFSNPRSIERGQRGTPILQVEHLNASYFGSTKAHHRVVSDVSFAVAAGECVALVGESGSGKTTIARAIVGLHARSTGSVSLRGERLEPAARDRTLDQRRLAQLIFQNPESALNPRQRTGEAIGRPAAVLRSLDRQSVEREVDDLLGMVRLPFELADRYPGELSGGEVQRVALARALAARPEILICDEVTSALDVSVQAAILELLAQLRTERGLAMLFVTHDLAVVATIADRVLVLNKGVICEQGDVEQILSAPQHAYTQRLLDAAPSLASA